MFEEFNAKLKDGEQPKIKIVEIPNGVNWYISSHAGGIELIHEVHRIWS